MKKIFRHGFVSYLLMLSLSISCYILLLGVNVFYNVRNENFSLKRYKEQLIECYDPTNLQNGETDYEKVVESLINDSQTIDTCNITFLSKVYINNRSDWYEVHVLVKGNEEIKLNVAEKISNAKGIYIGKSLEKYIGELSEKDEIVIDNKEYAVTGILENNMASDVDNSMFFIWDECDSKTRKMITQSVVDYIKEGFFKVIYESDDDIDEAVENFDKCLEEYGIYDLGAETLYSGDYQNYWYKYYNYIFIVISLIFSVVNCSCVSALWMNHRRHEIAIRLAYGYRKLDLFGVILKDAFFICIVSYMIALFLVMLFSYSLHLKNLFQDILGKLCMSFSAMVVILILVVYVSIKKYLKRNVVEI